LPQNGLFSCQFLDSFPLPDIPAIFPDGAV
jgi:hypothetical protein